MENKDETLLNVDIIRGNVAPRYTCRDVELKVDNVVITEKGMESGLPLINFQLSDKAGNVYFTALSGGVVNTLSEAIKRINFRNYGKEES